MKQSNWLKAYFVDVLPCLTMLLYALAIIYNISLYSVFDIEVFSFLSLTEMLLSIIEPLIVISVYIIFVALLIFLLISYTNYIILPYSKRVSISSRVKKIEELVLKKTLKIKFLRYLRLKGLKKQRQKNTETNKTRDKQSFGFIISMTICYCLLSYLQIRNNEITEINDGLSEAFYGVLMPLILLTSPVCVFGCLYFFVVFLSGNSKVLGRHFNYSSSEYIISGIIFYLYAVIIFYQSGVRQGESLISNNTIEFSIKTTDNNVFDDSNYYLISQANNKILLYDKREKRSLILYNENVISLSKHNNQSRETLFQQFLNSF